MLSPLSARARRCAAAVGAIDGAASAAGGIEALASGYAAAVKEPATA
jgi:hypothetical protein